MKYKLSEQAKIDIIDIFAFGCLNFGERQAQAYEESLFQAFERLSKWQDIGKNASEYMSEVQQYRCNKHYIFYTIEEDHVYITLIKHTSSNVRKHFEDHE